MPPISAEEIVKSAFMDPTKVERIAHRSVKVPISIEPYNPEWPAHFEHVKSTIAAALGETALCISHVGSTSVPGLPAKAVLDIDLTVPDTTAEADYIPALERAGFEFLLREQWYMHRFLVLSNPYHVNLHVFPPDSAELVRHLIMKEWLTNHEGDKQLYARTKTEAAGVSVELGEDVMQYNARKEKVILEILDRAYHAKGYLPLKKKG